MNFCGPEIIQNAPQHLIYFTGSGSWVMPVSGRQNWKLDCAFDISVVHKGIIEL